METIWRDVQAQKPRSGALRVKGGWVALPTSPKLQAQPMSDDEADRFLNALKGLGTDMQTAIKVANRRGIDLESREGRVALFKHLKQGAA